MGAVYGLVTCLGSHGLNMPTSCSTCHVNLQTLHYSMGMTWMQTECDADKSEDVFSPGGNVP